MSTLEQIRRMVELQLGRRDVGPDDRIVEDLGAESADIVNIIATVEERFGIIIDETELPGIRTVSDLHQLVQARS